ncbi:MAG TPA: metal ABC transporter permease [Acidiphilium sp.]|nr:MAG: cation ABC transporter permease [Acidiphilium sp. 21-60-14]OYV90735.1 MAG: cation ABC transporter permease [Acidiphilium sp. 37-60-79]OZB40044.1 MAG: cation ABC transporter permease [Acidiphilium sp. 34-60-192]HQT89005.1 metal ABC transporter permease [Acidiphilium sp.]HQU24102.1 metal ABC transporter permease [Acidiphilium sp.]
MVLSDFLSVLAGFWQNGPVQVALAVGGGAALVSAVVGVFTVLRGQAFAGHALADVSSAGGSASLLLGLRPLVGFFAMAALAAGGMEALGARAVRERDLVTGIVLGAGLGLTALFLYFDMTSTATTGAAVSVMFGSMFALAPGTVTLALGVAALALAASAALYRPLLLIALDPDLATIRGVRVRAVGFAHVVVLAMAVSLSAMTIGAILSTALLIGPAACGLRLARRTGTAIAIAAGLGLLATWGGIFLAYDSFYWTPGHGWPVSFFVVAIIVGAYALTGLRGRAG